MQREEESPPPAETHRTAEGKDRALTFWARLSHTLAGVPNPDVPEGQTDPLVSEEVAGFWLMLPRRASRKAAHGGQLVL